MIYNIAATNVRYQIFSHISLLIFPYSFLQEIYVQKLQFIFIYNLALYM